MTRLTEKDIWGLEQELDDYDWELQKKTGMSLAQIACFGAGIPETEFRQAAGKIPVSVVPVTAGMGIIGGFTQLVQCIVRHLGFRCQVTKGTDIDGIFIAANKGGIVFLADDHRFIALNLVNGFAADNNKATARGFVAALNGAASGLRGKEVLVLGAGPVGSETIGFLLELGAKVVVFDLDETKTAYFSSVSGVVVENDVDRALKRCRYLVDATPQGEFLTLDRMHSEVLVAAPGVPLGVNREAREKLKDRIIHDPLQIGVANMLAMAIMPRNCR